MATVTVALAFRTYREACAEALRLQRPDIDFDIADPEQLQELLQAEPPGLLIVSEIPCNIRAYQGNWLLLYPDGTTHGVIYAGSEARMTVENISFSDLLAIVDHLVGSEAGQDVSWLKG